MLVGSRLIALESLLIFLFVSVLVGVAFFPFAMAFENNQSLKQYFLPFNGERQLSTIDGNSIKGIDVSRNNGDINWTAVFNAGYKFAFVKATEGQDFNDTLFIENMDNGNAAGLFMGPYHFARPDTGINDPADANKEASDFVDRIRPYLRRGFLRPVLDLERGGPEMDRATLTSWVHNFMTTVKNKTGILPLIYVNSNYANNELDSSVTIYDLWIAHYTDANTPNTGVWDGNWDFWQYTQTGSIPGIGGNVDLDVFRGKIQDLNTFFVLQTQKHQFFRK